MKFPFSKIGLILTITYSVAAVFLIATQGLFGESFIALILGLPWSIALALFEYGSASGVVLYALVLGPIVLNAIVLYVVGVQIDRIKASSYGRLFGAVFGILFLIMIGAAIYFQAKSVLAPSAPLTQQGVTLEGTHVCLPHKNATGPQTLECALGIVTDDGVYYALDFGYLPQTPLNLVSGSRMSARGIITPIEELSSNHWQAYPIEGIFSVQDSVRAL